jgi:hypothetical protein
MSRTDQHRDGATSGEDSSEWVSFHNEARAAKTARASIFSIISNLTQHRKLRTIWIADANRGDDQHCVVRADEKLTAFAELEAATQFRKIRSPAQRTRRSRRLKLRTEGTDRV